MKDTDAAWLAGYIDGDGSIVMMNQTGRDRKRIMVTVDSADYELINRVNRLASGYVIAKKSSSDRHRQVWTWRLTGSNQVIELLEKIYPYLHCEFKKQRAKLLIDNWRNLTPRNGRYSDEQLKQKKILEEKFHQLGAGRGCRI